MARKRDSGWERSGLTSDRELALLTREDVVERVAGLAPGRIQRWATEVGGRRYPVKQVFRAAVGADRAFNSDEAKRLLERLEFPIIDAKALQSGMGPGSRPSEGALRLAALTAAVQHGQARPDLGPSDVLSVADAFLIWLGQDGPPLGGTSG